MPVQASALQSRHTSYQKSAPFGRAASLALALSFSAALSSTATAAPTVIVNNATDQTADAAQRPADPQVAPMPGTPFNPNTAQPNATASGANKNALDNPNSLASGMQPSDSDLSAANQELLSRNAQLQRDVNDLETRVNVLINERSGQLFMYGAMTVAVSLFLGFLLGGFVFSRRERW